MARTTADVDGIWDDWNDAVNMTASELEKWLGTDDVEHSRWRYSLMNWGNDPLTSP